VPLHDLEYGESRFKNYTQCKCLKGGKIIFKLLDLKSHWHHSQAGMTMNGIRPRPTMKPPIIAFLRVQVG